mgnify:CR=1 FL=1
MSVLAKYRHAFLIGLQSNIVYRWNFGIRALFSLFHLAFVFILWGASARRKAAQIDASRHVVIESPHPSPLSAHKGFFGTRPFSRANAALVEAGREPIDWCIP